MRICGLGFAACYHRDARICGSEWPLSHTTRRCDGRQKRRERSYYNLHRNLNDTLLHNYQLSIINCQLQSLVVLRRPTTALGEGLAGHLAALAVLDGDSLHSSRVAQGERLAVERALSCRCRAIGCVTDPVLLQDCRSDDSG